MDLRQLGKRIKNQREKRRLRQRGIASALQISSQAVSKWERGENAPDISLLSELSRLLGVSTDWLLGDHTPSKDTFEASVFCTSLNGFAQKAASMPPDEVAALANSVYYHLTESMLRHDGIPIKYLGDGFLGFFTGHQHGQRAVKCALEAKKMLPQANLVITIHCGDIYLGTIGHPDYSSPDIIGRAVNTAFLVMSWVAKNCATGIGITSSVQKYIKNNFVLIEKGSVDVPGHKSSIPVFEPTDLH